MAGTLLRTIFHQGRQINLYLASSGPGYRRVTEAIDKNILKEVGDRIEEEIEQFPDSTAVINIEHVEKN